MTQSPFRRWAWGLVTELPSPRKRARHAVPSVSALVGGGGDRLIAQVSALMCRQVSIGPGPILHARPGDKIWMLPVLAGGMAFAFLHGLFVSVCLSGCLSVCVCRGGFSWGP